MLFKTATRETHEVEIAPLIASAQPIVEHDDDAAWKAELRRQMYERIAQGNALAEIEDNAHRLWNGR